MAARYQHVTAAIQVDVAERVGGLLWTTTEITIETDGNHHGNVTEPKESR